LSDALSHQLPRQQQVGPGLENEFDRGELRHRFGAHHVQPRNAGERLLQRDGDQRFHLFGGESDAGRLNLYQRGGELGKDVNRHLAQPADAEVHQRRGDRDDDEAEFQARANDPTHHDG